MKIRTKDVSPHSGGDVGWSVMTTLIGGFLVWGGLGLLLDRLLETKFLAPVGLIIGMVLGIYAIVARFGSSPDEAKAPTRTSGKALVSSPGAWRYAQLARKQAAEAGESSTATPTLVLPSSDIAPRPTDPHRPTLASTTRENECP